MTIRVGERRRHGRAYFVIRIPMGVGLRTRPILMMNDRAREALQLAEAIQRRKVERLIRAVTDVVAHVLYIGVGVVLRGRRPPMNDLGDGVEPVRALVGEEIERERANARPGIDELAK